MHCPTAEEHARLALDVEPAIVGAERANVLTSGIVPLDQQAAVRLGRFDPSGHFFKNH